jgi:hypothetical protein
MNLPWSSPAASGVNPGQASANDARLMIEAFRSMPNTALWRGLPHREAILDVAMQRPAVIVIDRVDGGEHWNMQFNESRMLRMVLVLVKPARSFDGLIFDIMSSAIWHSDGEMWSTGTEHRWFGATSRLDIARFRETLRFAFEDAVRYTVDDLDPGPVSSRAPRTTHRMDNF